MTPGWQEKWVRVKCSQLLDMLKNSACTKGAKDVLAHLFRSGVKC